MHIRFTAMYILSTSFILLRVACYVRSRVQQDLEKTMVLVYMDLCHEPVRHARRRNTAAGPREYPPSKSSLNVNILNLTNVHAEVDHVISSA